MLIEWMGHSCFRLTLANGKKIVFDPSDMTFGIREQSIQADVALISHKHFDHSDLNCLAGEYKLIMEEGEFEPCEGVKIKGIKTYHDREQGALRGENIVFKVFADNLSVCHMGDLGEEITEELAQRIGHADIVMVPVGGNITIDSWQAVKLLKMIDANIVLPMHFRSPGINLPLNGIHTFLEALEGELDVSRTGKSSFEMTKDQLKKRTRVILLNDNY